MALDVQAHRLEQRRRECGVRRAITRRIIGRLPYERSEERDGVGTVRREKPADKDMVAHAPAAR
jgi:hypothetical protein